MPWSLQGSEITESCPLWSNTNHNIRNSIFYSEKGRQLLSSPQIYRSDFSTAPLIELAISSSALLSPQIWHNSDSRSNPLRIVNAI